METAPAYMEVYTKLKGEIQKGTYPISGFIPKESELEKIYGVSRTTIRKAVKMLSEEGLLKVRQGCGTIVCDNRTTQNYNRVTSITESLRKKGYKVTTGCMMIEIIKAPVELAQELRLPVNAPVAQVQRLQMVNGEPLTIMENYIPYDLVEGIEAYQNKFVALYEFLEKTYHLKIESTRDRIYAKSANFMEAQVLHVEPKEALLVVHRVCYNESRPVCVDHVRIIGNQYEVEIQGRGRNK